jgi:DNA polymerase-3 subunit gamma/tau
VDVRRLWPEVVEAVKSRRRVTWIQLGQHAQVVALEGKTLTVGFNNAGARESFVNGGGDLILQQSLIDLVGEDWRIDAIVDPSAQPGTEPAHAVTRPAVAPVEPAAARRPQPLAEEPSPGAGATTGPAASGTPSVPQERRPAPQQRRSASDPPGRQLSAGPAVTAPPAPSADDLAHRDDPDLDDVLDGAQLLTQRLGAKVIEEIPHD